MTSEHQEKETVLSRRDFLATSAFLTATVAGFGIIAGFFRFFKSDVRYEEPSVFKIGKPENFPVGTARKLDDKKVFVFSDDGGFYAISCVCTHLGCIVHTSDNGFTCPCHGSKYNTAGKVISGPAPRSLPWFEITQDVDGSLVVNAGSEVPSGTKVKYS
ncbi:MAG: Rieske (2Fe-2S) protein [Nitrospirae bacterium]|nr:Rieske (2Fe-2S) protein [Nitrospirota bacterium]